MQPSSRPSPGRKAPKKVTSPSAQPRARKLPERVLLIEDDDSFAQAFAYALEREYRCEVMIAADSFEAGNLMSTHPFELVITDWRLPLLNGFSALRRAEQSLSLDPAAPAEWFGKKVPVIVITACDSGEIERERRLKGCFQFLGVVSKGQPMDGILEQLAILYANGPLAPTG